LSKNWLEPVVIGVGAVIAVNLFMEEAALGTTLLVMGGSGLIAGVVSATVRSLLNDKESPDAGHDA